MKRNPKSCYIKLTDEEFEKVRTKAFVEGYNQGYECARFEAMTTRYTVNDLREAFGMNPVESEKDNKTE